MDWDRQAAEGQDTERGKGARWEILTDRPTTRHQWAELLLRSHQTNVERYVSGGPLNQLWGLRPTPGTGSQTGSPTTEGSRVQDLEREVSGQRAVCSVCA